MPHDGQTGVYFTAPDGARLLGTLFLAAGDAPKPTALLLHGVPGIEKNYDIAHLLRERGWNSLIFHYRGCWGSGGRYALRTQPADVQTALSYLSSGAHPQVAADKLVVVGHSMGGWAALLAALDAPQIKAVAVYGAVCNPQTLHFDAATIQAEFTPWLPGLSIEDFAAQWAALDDSLTPTRHVHRLHQPLLIVHGEQDTVVPIQQAQALAAQAPPGTRTRFHPQAGHSFPWRRGWLRETLWAFLEGLAI